MLLSLFFNLSTLTILTRVFLLNTKGRVSLILHSKSSSLICLARIVFYYIYFLIHLIFNALEPEYKPHYGRKKLKFEEEAKSVKDAF